MVLVACVVMGMGCGLVDIFSNAGLLDIHGARSTRYVGMLHGVYGVAAVVTPLALQGLMFIGWRWVMVLIAIPLLLFALQFIYVARRRAPGLMDHPKTASSREKGQMAAYLKRLSNLALAGCFFFYSAGQFGMMGWMVRYMTVRYDAEALGAVGLSIFWGCTALSRFVAPLIKKTPMQLSVAGLVGAGVFHLMGALVDTPAAMVVAAGLVGLCSGHCVPMLIRAAADTCPGNSALPTSVLMVSNKIAMMLIPLALGAVGGFSMRLSMYVGPVCTAIALVLGLAHMAGARRAATV